MVVALAGGIGGAKLLQGLYALLGSELTIVANTGDDLTLFGLRVCPDLDTILYTLSGRVNQGTGWGVADDGFDFLDEAEKLGMPAWFRIGNRDLATHVFRTWQLSRGRKLEDVTAELVRKRGLRCRILPMSREYVPTWVETDAGLLHFQEYFVREGCRPLVRGFHYGSAEAGMTKPCPGVLRSLARAERIIFCPSNPFISIGPILALRGVRESLRKRKSRVIAVSPMAGRTAFKGPTADMLESMGYRRDIRGVVEYYGGIVGTYLIDREDAHWSQTLSRRHAIRCVATNVAMRTSEEKEALARLALEA